ERIRTTLQEYGVTGITTFEPATQSSSIDSQSPITLTVGDLSVGFALPNIKLTVYTEADIFDEAVHADRAARNQSKSKRSQFGAFLSDFRDLKIGDYIVHIDHGIGQFQGLVQLDTSGPETSADIYARMLGAAGQKAESKREFMLLTYADGA